MRPDGRANDELRPVSFQRDFTDMADGSVLVSFGRTQVLCTASIDDDVPRWMRDSGEGWVTAEYNMLPGSSPERIRRRTSGRDQEIQRLIGRSLRAVCDMKLLGERSITVDCDVLQADGGTRTASITGGWVALHLAMQGLVAKGALKEIPLIGHVAAISCGIYQGVPVLDLDYPEDSNAETDGNFVITDGGTLCEIQATAEGVPFTEQEFLDLMRLAKKGCAELCEAQSAAVGS